MQVIVSRTRRKGDTINALIVYDSIFGNTEKIVRSVAEALNAKAVRVADARAEDLAGLGLLIAASPTHTFNPTPALAGWLKALPAGSLNGVRVAALDTRIRMEDIKSRLLLAMVKRFGYAADSMLATLIKKGGAQAAAPEGFFVMDSEGPLAEGEAQRAAGWAKALVK